MKKSFKPTKKRPAGKNIYSKVKKQHRKKRQLPIKYRPEKKTPVLTTASSWKKTGLIGVGSLIALILLIPTMIVVPFINTGSAEKPTEEKSIPVQVTEDEDEDDKQMTVSVMRNESDTEEEMPLEQYVTGVVSAEMPADFELEALKAQALAARTYIVNRILEQSEGDDTPAVSDTVVDQVYKSETELRERWGEDYNWKMDRVRKAVAATKGEVLTYDDVTITPAFFSTSNGYTENSEDYWEDELPYLRSVKSPWDKDSPKFLDQESFTLTEIEQTFGIQLPRNSDIPMSITRTDSSRVQTLELGGETFSGRTIREELGLRSSDFDIEHKNDHLVFTTKGFGHGIGMSQYGADGMASEGKTYQDIISHYYEGVDISELDETAPKLVMAGNEQ